MSKPPWNDWYHVTIHAYGAWLRGDARGWRTRDHQEHVDGDYKRPPAKGKFDRLLKQSKSLMKREAVNFDLDIQEFVLRAVVDRLSDNNVEVIVACADSKHLHVLGKFRDHRPRHWVGLAKKHASHLARQSGLRHEAGGLWGKKCGVKPINDRGHQVNVFHYILDHRDEGAIVWHFDMRAGK